MSDEPTTGGEGKQSGSRPVGRTPKLTPEVQEAVCRNLAGGCYIETACAMAGICQSTFFNWKQRGENGEEPYLQFLEAVTRAEVQAELRALAIIQKAGEEDPRHLEWWLERKFSDRWGRKDRQDIGLHGTPGQPPVTFSHLSAEEAIEIIGNGGPYRHEGGDDTSDGDTGTDAGD